jgi:hypothetical protein
VTPLQDWGHPGRNFNFIFIEGVQVCMVSSFTWFAQSLQTEIERKEDEKEKLSTRKHIVQKQYR